MPTYVLSTIMCHLAGVGTSVVIYYHLFVMVNNKFTWINIVIIFVDLIDINLTYNVWLTLLCGIHVQIRPKTHDTGVTCALCQFPK